MAATENVAGKTVDKRKSKVHIFYLFLEIIFDSCFCYLDVSSR